MPGAPSVEVEAVGSVATADSSLLDGPSFDERASSDAFQVARREWLQSLQPPPPAAPRSVDATATSDAAAEEPRRSCYQCYRLFEESAGRRVDGGGERWVCGAGCAAQADREQRLRAAKAQSMRDMEQRIRHLQEQQRLFAAQLEQSQEEEKEDTKVEDASPAPQVVERTERPLLSTVEVTAAPARPATAVLISGRRFTETDEQPEPVVELPDD